MIFSSNKIIKIIKKNIEITFLFLLLLITISSTSIYNEKKVLIDENYKNLINNIYFQKSINQIFDNLVPRYKNIDHKISSGETFDKILNNYSIPNEEINQIKSKLNSDYDINADFTKYKTFGFQKSGIDKVEISDLDKKRILRAIDSEMTKKGFTKSETPDLLINIFDYVHEFCTCICSIRWEYNQHLPYDYKSNFYVFKIEQLYVFINIKN